MSSPLDLRHVSFEGVTTSPARRRLPPPAPGVRAPALPPIDRPQPVASESAVEFGRWVLARARLDAAAYRAESVARRVPACLRALRARSEDEARHRISRHPELLEPALSALLIGVTSFFRDAAVFERLRTCVVPVLAAGPEPCRAWSAGCASGAEMYSFAMLLADAGMLDRAELLGTDCRHDVVAQAREASFRLEEARRVGKRHFAKYFEVAPSGQWRPTERLRHAVSWKTGSVLDTIEPGPWHVIFWRNTAIYLEPDVAARVCERLVAQLADGGFLVLGKAERPPVSAGLVALSACVYRKRGG